MKKHALVKYATIIALCVLLDVMLHVVTTAYSTMPEAPNHNTLTEVFGTEIIATLWALFAFTIVAYVFHRFHKTIPGFGITKGLRYGSAIALLWLVAMMEGVSLFGNPVINEFVVGLSDAIPVFLMGTLLGLFVANDGEGTKAAKFTYREKLLAICVFSAVFLSGRYVAYFTGIVKSGYETNPSYTFIWTLLMGVCVGIVYLLLGQAPQTSSKVNSSLQFGFWVFGVNWVAFLAFMPLLFNGFFVDFISRTILDILLVTTGSYLVLNLRNPVSKKPEAGTYKTRLV